VVRLFGVPRDHLQMQAQAKKPRTVGLPNLSAHDMHMLRRAHALACSGTRLRWAIRKLVHHLPVFAVPLSLASIPIELFVIIIIVVLIILVVIIIVIVIIIIIIIFVVLIRRARMHAKDGSYATSSPSSRLLVER